MIRLAFSAGPLAAMLSMLVVWLSVEIDSVSTGLAQKSYVRAVMEN